MKKLIILSVFIFGLLSAFPASAQTQKFYYYPASNVYYDISGNQYVYFDGGNWITTKALPSNIHVKKTSRVIVYHTGRNVWVGNAAHVKKYKTNKSKSAKVKAKGRS